MEEWFVRNSVCPTGCGHVCNFRPKPPRKREASAPSIVPDRVGGGGGGEVAAKPAVAGAAARIDARA